MIRGSIRENAWEMEGDRFVPAEHRPRVCRKCWKEKYEECLSCGAALQKPDDVSAYPAYNFAVGAPICPACAVLTPRIDDARCAIQQADRYLNRIDIPWWGRGSVKERISEIADTLADVLGVWGDRKIYPPSHKYHR